MSRLTLEWHLRGIIEGTTEPVTTHVDIVWSEPLGRFVSERYHEDPGSYTTGFPQDSGDYCDAFDAPALEALNSDDPVRFLDAVAQDPIRPMQERFDSAALLNHHIWPDSPRSTNSFADCERDDVDTSEWENRSSIGPVYFSRSCPTCGEGECLADIDTLREEGIAECAVCGTEQPEPSYP